MPRQHLSLLSPLPLLHSITSKREGKGKKKKPRRSRIFPPPGNRRRIRVEGRRAKARSACVLLRWRRRRRRRHGHRCVVSLFQLQWANQATRRERKAGASEVGFNPEKLFQHPLFSPFGSSFFGRSALLRRRQPPFLACSFVRGRRLELSQQPKAHTHIDIAQFGRFSG